MEEKIMIENDIKNLEEIIELCKEDIAINNKNVTCIMDIYDLKSLDNLIKKYKRLKAKENIDKI